MTALFQTVKEGITELWWFLKLHIVIAAESDCVNGRPLLDVLSVPHSDLTVGVERRNQPSTRIPSRDLPSGLGPPSSLLASLPCQARG